MNETQATLDALRLAGAQQLDPLRWHYLERLQERALAQAPAVQRVLEGRVALALADYQQRMHLAQQQAIETPVAPIAACACQFPSIDWPLASNTCRLATSIASVMPAGGIQVLDEA